MTTTPIDTTSIPPQVRSQGPAAEALYGSAMQFEQVLVQQLAQGLTDATQSQDTSDDDSGDDDGSSTSAAPGSGLGAYQSMLPDALAQSVTGGGGAGLALDLYRSLGGKEGQAVSVLGHLRLQLESARRLLGIMLAQSEAIRRQDVESVLARLNDLQGELGVRNQLEQERDVLLNEVARHLGRPAADLELDDLLILCPQAEADAVRAASAELRGLLLEISRVHEQNRVLIRQELTFLDHLMRLLSGAPQAGYRPGGWASAPQTMSVVDAKA